MTSVSDDRVFDLVSDIGLGPVLESLIVVVGARHAAASSLGLHSDCVYWSQIATHLCRAYKVSKGEDPNVEIKP